MRAQAASGRATQDGPAADSRIKKLRTSSQNCRAVAIVIIGEIREIETIAAGPGIRQLRMLSRLYGRGRWRKRKGIARIQIYGERRLAELHWYEAHGIGRVLVKVKRFLEES